MRDATYLSQLISNKKLSHEELFESTLSRIKQENSKLNALVDFDEDLYRKRHFSALDISFKDTLFQGIPIPLKILGQSKQGFLDTSASRLFKNNFANYTNNFVKSIEKSGLLPIGKTNAPEFGFKNVTDSKLYGDAHNPWNIAYSPGGSSGGAAATVASGMFPIAAASDGGGSIRIPASFNGLIGLKPTRGAVPVGPRSFRGWQGASIDFALTISMRDTESLFLSMRDTSSISPFQPPKIEWEKPPSKNKLKIAYTFESPIGTAISNDAKSAMQKTLGYLEDAGYELTEIHYPLDGLALMDSYYKMNAAETAKMFNQIEKTIKRNVTLDDMELMTWGIYQYGLNLSAIDYSASLDVWDSATQIMEETIFSNYDLFLTPTTADMAPGLNRDLQSETIRNDLRNIDNMSTSTQSQIIFDMFYESLKITPFTQLANLTGQPAISLPLWVSKNGLPLGAQFMAAKGREDLLFQVGKLLEEQDAFELPAFYKKND